MIFLRSVFRKRIVPLGILITILLFVGGCATPVGVRAIDPKQVQRNITRSILSSDLPSAPTMYIINRADLYERFSDQPEEVLEILHKGLPTASESDRLFALAELSYAYASEGGPKSYYYAAAIYAYAFLFPDNPADVPLSSDPRVRIALDLYNLSLSTAFLIGETTGSDITDGQFALPFGKLIVTINPEEFEWGAFRLANFVRASAYDIRGLRNRYRWPGIGAPLIATAKPMQGKTVLEYERIPPNLKMPVTAFLRIHNAGDVLTTDRVTGVLELYTPVEATQVDIHGRSIPLEYELSSALAYTLEGSRAYSLELEGLLSGDLILVKDKARYSDNIFFMAPYRRGLIPVVFVHGTASSPVRWAEMVNELSNDPQLWNSYQFWLFTYNTGNPVVYSAGILNEGLRNIVHQLDPQGKDPTLQEIVVIGHSQGGLLTKLCAVESGDIFWNNVSQMPFDELQVSPEAGEILRRSLFFEPVPAVKRVVFLSTPHGGSYLVGGWVSRLLRKFISLPRQLVDITKEVLTKNPQLEAMHSLDNIPRSTDDMDPDGYFVKAISDMPIAPDIKAHSIIAVANADDPREEWTDGVVQYKSAHLEGVASELIVHSGHSTQDHPATIEEVRRILLEHLVAFKTGSQ